jgi:hypothetical protein
LLKVGVTFSRQSFVHSDDCKCIFHSIKGNGDSDRTTVNVGFKHIAHVCAVVGTVTVKSFWLVAC